MKLQKITELITEIIKGLQGKSQEGHMEVKVALKAELLEVRARLYEADYILTNIWKIIEEA